MDKRMRYFPEEDILHIVIKDGPEASSVELGPNITAELDDAGDLIGIEITSATDYVRDSILETAQGRLLQQK